MSTRIIVGDCRDVLATLPDQSVHCCMTSPPYFGLRDYGMPGQIGLEPTPNEYVGRMVEVFRAVRRLLKDDGTLWLNLGDSYVQQGASQQGVGGDRADRRHTQAKASVRDDGLPPKNLIGIPWRVAFALQADGWYLRQDIIWHKPNPMPESVRDRCTKAHEYVFLLSKSERYYFDSDAMQEPAARPEGNGNTYAYAVDGERPGANANLGGSLHRIGPRETRNKRSVWTIATQPFSGAHFATMAPELAETCIKAGCPAGGTVLDPFGGSGTTGLVADQLQRHALLIELNPAYAGLAERRIVGAVIQTGPAHETDAFVGHFWRDAWGGCSMPGRVPHHVHRVPRQLPAAAASRGGLHRHSRRRGHPHRHPGRAGARARVGRPVRRTALTLWCRPVGKGNWTLIVINIDTPADLFRFKPEHRFTWGDPPQTLRIVRVLP